MNEKVSLKNFVEDNYRLIATTGVFGAVTTLFLRFEGVEDIALIPFLIFFILMLELLDTFPEIEVPLKSSVTLLLFQFLMLGLLMAVGWYILINYVTQYYKLFALFVFIGLYSFICMKIWLKIRPLKRIHDRVKGELYGFIRFILLLVIVGTIMVISNYSVNFVISLLENFLF